MAMTTKTPEEFKAHFGYEMPTNLSELHTLSEHCHNDYHWLNYYGSVHCESETEKLQELDEYLAYTIMNFDESEVYLNLCENQLTEFPESICNLTKLQTLWISYNKLTELPESIGNLSELKWLYINTNQLTELPESIGNLSKLQTLDIRNNPIPVERRAAIQVMLPNTTIYW